jgi:hypothetical protein
MVIEELGRRVDATRESEEIERYVVGKVTFDFE